MTHWIIREWMNAVTFALSLCLTIRFVRVRIKTPTTEPRYAAATALAVLCAGETVRAGWAWLALASQNKKWPIFILVQESYWVAIIATGLITTGAVCCIRVFSGKRHGGIGAFLLAIGALLITIAL